MRKLIPIFIVVFFTINLWAIPTDSIFLKMPDNLLPTLARKQRFELAEYFKAGKADSIPNLFGLNTILQKYDTTNCHILLKTSANGFTEIKKFTFSTNQPILGIIQTIYKPVKISDIQFFTEEWLPVKVEINIPDVKNWIYEKQLSESTVEPAWVDNLLHKSLFSMQFTDTNELEVENNVLNTLSLEDRKLVEPFFVNKPIRIKIDK